MILIAIAYSMPILSPRFLLALPCHLSGTCHVAAVTDPSCYTFDAVTDAAFVVFNRFRFQPVRSLYVVVAVPTVLSSTPMLPSSLSLPYAFVLAFNFFVGRVFVHLIDEGYFSLQL